MTDLFLTTIPRPEFQSLVESCVANALRKHESELGEQDSSKVLNVKEAAEYLNLAVATVYSLTSKRLIPFSKMGKRLYFSQDALAKWIASGYKKTVSEIESETARSFSSQRTRRSS